MTKIEAKHAYDFSKGKKKLANYTDFDKVKWVKKMINVTEMA